MRRGRVHLPTRPDPDFFFQNLDRYRAASFAIKHHAMKQMVFTGPDLGAYDHIYDAARLDEVFADLSSMTGRQVAASVAAPQETIKMRDLEPETRAIIRAEAAADYDAFSGFLVAA